MRKPQPHEILQQAFPGILEAEADRLIASGRVRSFPSGVTICQEGALEKTFYIILDGEVKVTKKITNREERLLNHLYAGDFFGEMALIHETPRTATVTAIVPTEVLEIDIRAFDEMLKSSTSVAIAMVREVSRRLRENDIMAIEDLQVKANELSEAYRQLAEQEAARRQFLTTIAHELRTPLTVAGGYLQMARRSLTDELSMLDKNTLATALNTVAENLQRIITLVNDILFLQEMELIFSEFKAVNVGRLVMAVVEACRSRAEQNGIHLHLEIAPNVPDVLGDERSLERALNAIVDNAIKFSPQGGNVSLSVTHGRGRVCLTVQDSGVGIPEEIMPRIFERFFHIDEINGHLFSGVGLGLSIAKEVIEQHGGEIIVESPSPDSPQGKGTTVTVRLRS